MYSLAIGSGQCFFVVVVVVFFCLFVCLFVCLFLVFLGLPSKHMEVPRPGVELEL